MKMEGNKFDNAKLKILQHSKPTLEEILHSDLQPNDIYLERNYLLTMTNKPIHDCSKKCFTMSACDMFEYEFDTKTCKMLPHLSLKDEVWTNFAVSTNDRKFAIFIHQCSTALEDIAIGNDFEPGTDLTGMEKYCYFRKNPCKNHFLSALQNLKCKFDAVKFLGLNC